MEELQIQEQTWAEVQELEVVSERLRRWIERVEIWRDEDRRWIEELKDQLHDVELELAKIYRD